MDTLHLMSIRISFEEINVEGYERVVSLRCPNSGLNAIISIHNTNLGPSLGGIRALNYQSFQEALDDVLKLSKGMTYKAAISGMETGGGKSVIILEENQILTNELLKDFAKGVDFLKGRYICAEDMGVDCSSVEIIRSFTDYVVGLEKISGDPARFTSYGVYLGMRTVAGKLWGSNCLKEKTVAIQGLGAVGMRLAERLFWSGANLIVSDISEKKVADAVKYFGAKAVDVDDILYVDCDILAPCARGGVFHTDNVKYLSCKSIVGAANNQLDSEIVGDRLFEAGIVYAPDYLVNSGGLINVAQELNSSGYNSQVVREKTWCISDKLDLILQSSEERQLPPVKIANQMAEESFLRSHASSAAN